MNSKYDSARIAFGTKQIDWLNDNIKCAALSPSYPGGTIALTTHSTFNDIASYVLTGSQPIITLTNKVTSVGSLAGAFSSGQFNFVALSGNQTIGFLAIFKDYNLANINGAPLQGSYGSQILANQACPLIALMDSGEGIGAGTNGFDIQVIWDTTKGIFRL